jgi:fido (protein-threonine AMPylation protein)
MPSELNEAEQKNILEAEEWATARKRDVLSEVFLRNLHKRMFGRVWRWAGKFRQSARNIGVDAYRIPQELRCAAQITGAMMMGCALLEFR